MPQNADLRKNKLFKWNIRLESGVFPHFPAGISLAGFAKAALRRPVPRKQDGWAQRPLFRDPVSTAECPGGPDAGGKDGRRASGRPCPSFWDQNDLGVGQALPTQALTAVVAEAHILPFQQMAAPGAQGVQVPIVQTEEGPDQHFLPVGARSAAEPPGSCPSQGASTVPPGLCRSSEPNTRASPRYKSPFYQITT